MSNEDKIKQVLGKSGDEIFTAKQTGNHHAHSSNAFCGTAGREELNHLDSLLDNLSDDEIVRLIDGVKISFGGPTKGVDREMLESVVDEADREDFYREYHAILASRA